MLAEKIGLNAGVVWRQLEEANAKMSFKQLEEKTGLSSRDLNAAIGWLAREGKIIIEESKQNGAEAYSTKFNSFFG